MNKVSLIGRLGKDPEIRYTTGKEQMAIARLSLAVERKFSGKGSEKQTDWISCIAFGKTAENIGKYFHKGSRIGITGRIQTGSYEGKDGQTRYSFDVIIEDFDFIDSKNGGSKPAGGQQNEEAQPQEGYYTAEEDIDEEDLPF